MKEEIIKILDDNLDFEFIRGGGIKQFINCKDFDKIAEEIVKLCSLHSAVKSEATLPLREFIEAVSGYVNDQENHEIKRSPARMATIKAVAHWCKRFAVNLSK